MFEIPDLNIEKESDYVTKYSLSLNEKKINIKFSKNDYGIIFISSDINDKRYDSPYVIYIPLSLKTDRPDIVNQICSVHASVPIFFTENMQETLFSYGLIIGMMSSGAFEKCQ